IGLGASTTERYANRATRIVNDGESGGTRTRLGGLEDDVHIERLSSVDGHWKRLREGELGCLRSRKGKRVDHQVSGADVGDVQRQRRGRRGNKLQSEGKLIVVRSDLDDRLDAGATDLQNVRIAGAVVSEGDVSRTWSGRGRGEDDVQSGATTGDD